jgi:phosphate/sulfate permease
MIQVDPRTRNSIWSLIAVLLAAGWAAYGLLGGGPIFLTIMVVLSIVGFGVVAAIFQVRKPS